MCRNARLFYCSINSLIFVVIDSIDSFFKLNFTGSLIFNFKIVPLFLSLSPDLSNALLKPSIIIGTNKEAYSLSLVRKYIKEAKITNRVLFMIEAGLVRTFALGDNTDNHYFIERPFRIHHFNKKISTILAKVSNPNELIHKLGPFIFFPLKKALMLGEKTKV